MSYIFFFLKLGRSPDSQRKILLPSVSTSLLLALGLGIAEAVGLSFGSGFLMNTMGISVVCLNLENKFIF